MDWIPTEEEAIQLLKAQGADQGVIDHTRKVVEVVKKLATGLPVDRKVVIAAAALHDIGRSNTHGVAHGVIGARILAEQGVDQRVVRIVERHVGAGIPKSEGGKLGLPNRDLIPETAEEKLVCYADKLLIGIYLCSESEAFHDFQKKLGKGHPALERMQRLFGEMHSLLHMNAQEVDALLRSR